MVVWTRSGKQPQRRGTCGHIDLLLRQKARDLGGFPLRLDKQAEGDILMNDISQNNEVAGGNDAVNVAVPIRRVSA